MVTMTHVRQKAISLVMVDDLFCETRDFIMDGNTQIHIGEIRHQTSIG